MAGYWNKIVEVNLSTGEISDLRLGDDVCRDYMGGAGVGAWLMARRVTRDTDPLGPENPLIFMTGPLTGTSIPGAATRYDVQARSPLTGIWGESSNGGRLGIQMKRAGIDGILITGASDRPALLKIIDGKASIEDASDLWGKNTYETMKTLRDRIKQEEGKSPSVAAIGPAGENLVKFANIMNEDGNAAGRAGLGAVMGSKKLKAIAVLGTLKPEFADADSLAALRKEVIEKIADNIPIQSMTAFGTNGAMDLCSMTGDLPIKNWRMGAWDDGVEKINGPTLTDTILTKNSACYGCNIACKRVVKVDDEKYGVPESAGPEYETAACYGTMMLIDNLAAIAKINEICNQLGMDSITSGSTLAFLCECVDRGLISKADLDGIDLKWSAPDAVIELLGRIAAREGCGDWIAEGSASAAERIGKNAADFLTTVNRLEAPMHDPRGFHGQALAYATSSRGACHVNAMEMMVEQGYVFYPDIGLGDSMKGQSSEGKAKMVAISQNVGALLNAACICHFPAIAYSEHDLLRMINLATGFGYDLESLVRTGERMWTLKRAINNMFGLTRENDRLPKRLLTPLEDGNAAGSVPDIALMLKEYYEVRDIDEQGRPSKEKLESLGLGYMIEKIY